MQLPSRRERAQSQESSRRCQQQDHPRLGAGMLSSELACGSNGFLRAAQDGDNPTPRAPGPRGVPQHCSSQCRRFTAHGTAPGLTQEPNKNKMLFLIIPHATTGGTAYRTLQFCPTCLILVLQLSNILPVRSLWTSHCKQKQKKAKGYLLNTQQIKQARSQEQANFQPSTSRQ